MSSCVFNYSIKDIFFKDNLPFSMLLDNKYKVDRVNKTNTYKGEYELDNNKIEIVLINYKEDKESIVFNIFKRFNLFIKKAEEQLDYFIKNNKLSKVDSSYINLYLKYSSPVKFVCSLNKGDNTEVAVYFNNKNSKESHSFYVLFGDHPNDVIRYKLDLNDNKG